MTAVLVIIVFFILQLFRIQIIHGDEYVEAMKSSSRYTVGIEATRGEILDQNGKKIVSSKQANNIIFNALYFPSSSKNAERNEIILRLIRLFESRGEAWEDELPIELSSEGVLVFKEDSESDVAWLKSSYMLNLNDYATAQNCFDALVEMYELEEENVLDALKIASVRFKMVRDDFSVRNPFVFARDVTNSMVAVIKENGDMYQGVDVEITTERQYADPSLAVHILGTLGVVSSEEYSSKNALINERAAAEPEKAELYKRSLYKMTSLIGKSGIEKLAEDYLRGKSGEKQIGVDSEGNVTEKISLRPERGNTVISTINIGLQEIAQKALKSRILELTAADGLEAAGSVVVLDVKTRAVLACASYPGYDLQTYYDDYDKLIKDKASPLWNRALQSVYEPGSTIKPAIAIAALQEGIIDRNTRFLCSGTYEYRGSTFSCLDSHGYINVEEALNYSCNIFFYTLADKLGIARMNNYCSLFGLGSATGVELPEASGILAGPAYRESIGSSWLPGDTVQAAIGQSDNLFTPIQLANYCATIAADGERYKPYFIGSIRSADYSETIYEARPQLTAVVNASKESFDIVKLGMRDVATIGTCAAAFENLPYTVAAKTGTSQTQKVVDGNVIKGNNGFLITFGPYDDAEIAIAVVIENINSGTATAKVAADIYEYYFSTSEGVASAAAANTLLP